MTRRSVLVLAIVAALLAACGGDQATLSSDARADLQGRVDLIRSAAADRDRGRAEFLLLGLREKVRALEESGEMSEQQSVAVLAAADDVEDELDLVPTTTTTVPTLPPDEGGKGPKGPKGGKKGKG